MHRSCIKITGLLCLFRDHGHDSSIEFWSLLSVISLLGGTFISTLNNVNDYMLFMHLIHYFQQSHFNDNVNIVYQNFVITK